MTPQEPDTPAVVPSRRVSPTSRARRIGGLSRPSPGPGERPQAAVTPDADDGERASAPTPAAPDGTPAAATATRPTPEVSAPPAEPGRAEAPTWLRWLPGAALGLAAVIMLAFFLVVSHGVWWGRASAQAVRDEVLAAAKSCTVATNTWHYNTFAADEAKGVACTTGGRTTAYRQAMQTLIKSRARQLQASQAVQVNYAGISDVSPNGRSWNILVVGQLTIRQLSHPQGQQDPFAALVRMDRVHGRWLMAGIQEVSGPTAK